MLCCAVLRHSVLCRAALCCAVQDDVNAVTYADASPNVIVSGSDDTFIKVPLLILLQRRSACHKQQGVLALQSAAGCGQHRGHGHERHCMAPSA